MVSETSFRVVISFLHETVDRGVTEEREGPAFCGLKAIANANSSAGFGANILEKARSGGLYIKRQVESKLDCSLAPGWLVPNRDGDSYEALRAWVSPQDSGECFVSPSRSGKANKQNRNRILLTAF
jgi:hypothetical protein